MSSPDTETSGAAEAPQAEAEATEPVDELRAGLLAVFERELGPGGVVASHIRPGDDIWVRVAADKWVAAHEVAKTKLDCHYFGFLSAIDWLPSPWGRYEDAEVDDAPAAHPTATAGAELSRGYTGGDTRFQIFSRVMSVTKHYGITLMADIPADTMTLDTLIPVYAGADWHEREAWEMFGVTFTGHPNLIHIYLPGEFEGNPLRKDFPLLARIVKPWPGIVDVEPMPGGDDDEGESAEGGD